MPTKRFATTHFVTKTIAQLFLLFLAPCDVVRSTVAMHDVKYLGVA